MRLIDADVVIENIDGWLNCVGNVMIGKGHPYTWVLMGCIEDAPTIEAEPVKHGRWVEKPLDNFRKVEVQCSMCGWRGVDNYDSYVDICDFNYCPNCGAKMDAEE